MSLEHKLSRMFTGPRRRRPTTRYAKTQITASEATEARELGVEVGSIREGNHRGMIVLHKGASEPLMRAYTTAGGVTDLLRQYRRERGEWNDGDKRNERSECETGQGVGLDDEIRNCSL